MYRHKYFKVERQGDVPVIHLVDARFFDHINIAELADELADFLEAEKPRKLLLNFAGITHCPTEFMGSVLSTRERVAAHGGEVKLYGMSAGIRELFKVSRLDGTVLGIYDTADDALKAFADV
jgi:anti-anti-sigma regulatory factor